MTEPKQVTNLPLSGLWPINLSTSIQWATDPIHVSASSQQQHNDAMHQNKIFA